MGTQQPLQAFTAPKNSVCNGLLYKERSVPMKNILHFRQLLYLHSTFKFIV